MTADEGNVKIEKFDDAKFGFWKMQIEDFVYQKNLYQPLSGKQPEGMKNEDWVLLDKQALEVIRLTLSHNVAFYIAKEKTTVGLMAALSNIYEKPSASNKVHLIRYCQAPKKDIGTQESANMIEETVDAMILSINSPIESWILDSGASFHSTPCQEIIENYVSGDFGKVHLADDETLKIVRKGDIRLKLSNQTNWKLKGAVNGKLLMVRRLILSIEKGMKTLLSKGNLSDLKNIDVRLCEDCIFGKQKKVSFVKIGKTHKAEKLELVHTDVWGPSPVSSLASSLYYVTFIDDSTKKIIRRRDVIFNENVMYKAWSTIESRSSKTEAETKEFVEFEEISGNDVQISPEAVQEEPGTPKCYDEEMQVEDSVKWKSSMKNEMDSIISNQTWELAELPPGKKALHNKWVYRIKEEHDGRKRYNERLVVKGFQQKEGIDYNEIFSPVVKLSTIRLVLKSVAAENLHLEQLDVKTTFLHGDLEEEIYMRLDIAHAMGAVSRYMNNPGKVHWEAVKWILRYLWGTINKTLYFKGRDTILTDYVDTDLAGNVDIKRSITGLYGLKQAPIQWYKKFDSFMSSSGFTRCQADHCCYIKKFDNNFIILLLYIDEILVVGSDMQDIINVKQKLSKQFVMKDLGAAKQILGMRIKRDTKSGTLILSQAEYINKVLSRFNMQDVKPVSTPFGVHFRLSKEQSLKTEEERAHMVKVLYASVIGSYVDTDLAGNVDIRRSMTWYVYTLGGTAVSWVSQLQKIVALSTTEAEYVVVMEANKEMGQTNDFMLVIATLGMDSIDEEDDNNKGRMWDLDQKFDKPMDEKAGKLRNMDMEKNTSALLLLRLAFQSFGVVYGDLGTSPLYVFYNTFPDKIEDPEDVVGALSLIIYSLTLIALNKRNVKRWLEKDVYKKHVLRVLVLIGTCNVIGDGILTPALSVLSASGGINVEHPSISNGVAVVILVGLFSMQHYGTDRVSWLFAPIVLLWFLVIGGIGTYNICTYDSSVLKAFSPIYICQYFKRRRKDGWISLGEIMLSITAVPETSPALGKTSPTPFNRTLPPWHVPGTYPSRPRVVPVPGMYRLAFTGVVFPCLLLANSGQAAYLSQNRDDVGQAFYRSIPDSIYWPVFGIAIAAAIVASQATISATFSIIKQALAHGCFPRVKVEPMPNRQCLCMNFEVHFEYMYEFHVAAGTAVVFVMFVTTLLMTLIMILVWRSHWIFVVLFTSLSLVVECTFISAVLFKIDLGGWIPLVIAGAFLVIMNVWHYGRMKRYEFEMHDEVSMAWLLGLGPSLGLVRVPGMVLVYTELSSGVPHIFSHFITNLPAIHSVVVFVCVKYRPVYTVPEEERYGYKDLHRKDDDFEKKVFDSLFSFVRLESMMEGCSESDECSWHEQQTEVTEDGVFNSEDNNLVTSNTDTVVSSFVHPGVTSMEDMDELEFLNKCREAEVVHILRNTEVRARRVAGFYKEKTIDYIYAFLRKICRENSVIFNVPRESLLSVGQIVYV
ncbi:putative potassium transporter 12 [Hibiscus syriacus]|uniref:Potassium transporter 12 n=1 Tax=Hibiscus syriacus TaxID=106335 RepID=A0A6A3APN4_HIBSY|nr:putative potassium transporter 12 [Hibiscus syriacus]